METIDIICFGGALGSLISYIFIIYCKIKYSNNNTKIVPYGIIINSKVVVVPENNINRNVPIATIVN